MKKDLEEEKMKRASKGSRGMMDDEGAGSDGEEEQIRTTRSSKRLKIDEDEQIDVLY